MSELSISTNAEAVQGAIDRLTKVSEEVPERATEEILKLAGLLAQQASAKALVLPTHGRKHTGLRKRVSEGVKVVPNGNGGGTVITTMEDSREAIIPRGMDLKASNYDGWNHPLFGRAGRWYRIFPTTSWFLATMSSGQKAGLDRLSAMLEQVAEGQSSD